MAEIFRNIIQGVPKNGPLNCFCNNFGKCTPILIFFTFTTRKLWRTKFKLFQPPHLYYVATLPSETNTDTVSMSLLRHYCVCV